MLSGREPMFETLIQEAAALASVASPLTTERFPGEQRVEVLVDLL